ncbi:MAG: nucleotidyltransferase domain-containing protein [Gemmatimonadota bacterium]|nr:nucleotidyltransferase domain-containing protein [Gemmatimonadota bacterium]
MPRRLRARPARGPKATDALSLALASGAFATLVRYFTVRPDHAPHVRALMRETGLPARSLQQELARMTRLGLVRQEYRADRRVYVHTVAGHPGWHALRALVRTYAPAVDIVRVTVSGVRGIALAFVFGSVARGDAVAESDCDVFVVTEPGTTIEEKRAVVQALAVQSYDAGAALGRELSFAVYSVEDVQRLLAVPHGFVSRVFDAPKLWVRGSDEDLRAWQASVTTALPAATTGRGAFVDVA